MSINNLSILTKQHVLVLFLCIILKYYPKEQASPGENLSRQCEYDTKHLCPSCFSEPNECSIFKDRLTIDTDDPLNRLVCRFNQHAVSYGVLDGKQNVVIKSLNKNGQVEKLRDSICKEFQIATEDCEFRNDELFRTELRQMILNEDRVEGMIICPSGDDLALERFLKKIEENELLKLILMLTNAQPLLLKLFNGTNLRTPEPVFQMGFTLAESFDGDSLANFYSSSLKTRLTIANELISAILSITAGLDGFRFYLTDINPDNIAIQFLSSGNVKVSFIDINNVIVLDSQSKRLDRNKPETIHARIECDGCFAYVQEEICSHRYSDINLFAMCQLFLENLNGNGEAGFLHFSDDRLELKQIHQLLKHCVYCRPPDCQDRKMLLQQIQKTINLIM
ncbi:uncharacterized protein LOC131691791 [Topomyia yanbarensis]|uniref:uncharacterized protein LOC131691791 n=1 Tax=Topomyia yanbarensis TaxID=2498891 RepID=UPI00273B2192|nr:uncharacterized protein LOC131691791 [Topomyia yanbarensis]